MKKLKLIAVLVFFPLCLNVFGTWELQRSTERSQEIAEIQADLKSFRPDLEAMVAQRGTRPVMVDIGGGEKMELNLALARVIEAQDELNTQQPLTAVMTGLAKSVIVLGLLAALPLVLPAEEMATQLPHPSDTHPSNGERVASLQVSVEEAVRNGTRPMDAALACAAMDGYFADPQALRTRLTSDYLSHYVTRDAAVVEELRAHASNVTGNVEVHEGARLRGLLLLIFFGLMMLLGLVMLAVPWLFPVFVGGKPELLLIGGAVIAVLMLLLLPFALRIYLRAPKTALLLTPDHLVFANLKAPLPIRDVADFGLLIGQGVILNILLEDDALLPELLKGSFFAPNARLVKKKRMVQLQLIQYCRDDKKLKLPELAELIGSYLNAGAARHILQQRFEQG